MKFGIIGLGNVGFSLSLYLKEKSLPFSWWTESESKRREYEKIIGECEKDSLSVFEKSDLIFLCIKDDEIENFVKEIKIESKKMAVHLSGTLSLSVLNPLKEKGFYIGSFHPIQTFSSPSPSYFKDIYASFVGDEEIYEVLKKVFDDVKIIKVKEEEKFLIHLASTISSNFFVFLLRKSNEILKDKNLSIEILFPLIKTTFENIKKEGVYKALTGPAKRKDYNTLFRHEKYIYENFPEFFRIYLEITRELLKNETI